ncbi:MAG: 2-polyprenyl-3-methyl-6-methoxy-1,4-benzoquinone monooxygenase [Mariprofundaceae bacterium]
MIGRMHPPPSHSYSLVDQVIMQVDSVLHSIFCKQATSRNYPAESLEESDTLTHKDKQLSAGLMRVNHAGEMAAQALYQGQSLTASDPTLREKLQQASVEESDHLNWCRRRLESLDAQPSRLDPLIYMGSLALGVAAGIAGDRWNLGFLAETEHQVVRHLDSHLKRLPTQDHASRAIIEQMREDELGHATLAESMGAAELPPPVKTAMKVTAKVMTTLSERF